MATVAADEMIEVMARAIARGMGDEYANALKNKQRWVAKRGMSGGRFRDINEPFRSDYDAAARAALAAILPVMRDDIANEAFRFAQYARDTATQVDAAIRARFDQIAKEIKP